MSSGPAGRVSEARLQLKVRNVSAASNRTNLMVGGSHISQDVLR